MAKIVVITSGKGGVGKTTTSASFAAGLALRGYKTVVIDFDVGLRNLDLLMGCENRIVYDFVDVISGNARLQQALVKDKQLENLYILPASQTRDKDALTDEGVAEVIEELSKQLTTSFVTRQRVLNVVLNLRCTMPMKPSLLPTLKSHPYVTLTVLLVCYKAARKR